MQISYGQRRNKADYKFNFCSGSPKDKTVDMFLEWTDENKFGIRTLTFNEKECQKLLSMIVACLYMPIDFKQGISNEQINEKLKELFL